MFNLWEFVFIKTICVGIVSINYLLLLIDAKITEKDGNRFI